MNVLRSITRSNFFIRLKSWEYWPFGIVHFPAILYYLWLSIRSRSFVFFSASNPGIPMGGMFGESKYDILKKIPDQFIPKTILVPSTVTLEDVLARIMDAGMDFPLIFKPDIGERGYRVEKITNRKEVERYFSNARGPFIIQDWIAGPLEYGVFYIKFPGHEKGRVTSLVAKEMLFVEGNGSFSLRELILEKDRAKLQWKTLKVAYCDRLDSIIPAGERVELVPIGNHVLGARFINANDMINDALSNTFNNISSEIPGFYFGRFDVRCEVPEDLYSGNVKIMELNGCGAEPAHIYDKNFPIHHAASYLVSHWHNIFKIAQVNKKSGIRYLSHREAWAFYKKFRTATK